MRQPFVDFIDPVVQIVRGIACRAGRVDRDALDDIVDQCFCQRPQLDARAQPDGGCFHRIPQQEELIQHGAPFSEYDELLVAVARFVALVKVLPDEQRSAIFRHVVDQVVTVIMVEAVGREIVVLDKAVVSETAAFIA